MDNYFDLIGRDAMIAILKLCAAKDISSFAITCKDYIALMNNVDFWGEIVNRDLGYPADKFVEMANSQCDIKISKLYRNIKKEVEDLTEDARWPINCIYICQKGPHRGERCGRITERRSNFCGICYQKTRTFGFNKTPYNIQSS